MRKILLTFVMAFSMVASAQANNYSLLFDGVDDYIRVPDSDSLDLSTGMTIEAWIKLDNLSGAKVIVSKWDDPTNDGSYIFKKHQSDDNRLSIEVTPVRYSNVRSFSTLTSGNWTHVAATFDRYDVTDFPVKLYINGFYDNSDVVNNKNTNIRNSAADLLIGAVNGYSGLEAFSGMIDEVRIWNYARTQEELGGYKNLPLIGNEPGLVGYWNFDEGAGSKAGDLTKFGNNGTIYGAQWASSGAPVVTPEPSSMILFGVGGLAMVGFRRRRDLIKKVVLLK